MFKLESYVTPLLLSYVDKFIKNLKPEDSQLSLWGGDASFCNLDLRLDVLEKELDLPFTFVNGHIHELRIHVPWTKLGSEPVVITINTIECILKLHTDSDGEESSHAQKSVASPVSKKAARKAETPEAPPGYVQSLINRVLGNICIVCNNLILKYVEDDIVLSLNIKSAELFNVNEKWERAFIDIYPEVTVRKIISMQDLTVCLDQRDASGKIETYQDPLLYRCSTVWRLYSAYNLTHSKCPDVTRINMFCDKLDFSLTDQQLPMFLRLMKLCYALQYKNDCLISKKQSYSEDVENRNQSSDDETDATTQNEGWGSWAWSYIPQVFPVWNEDGEEQTMDSDLAKSQRILQFGIFIDKASCVFKTTEATQDSCYGSAKFSFAPFAVLHQYGCSMELTLKGKEFLNVQLGVTGATISGLSTCVCDSRNLSDAKGMEKPYLRAGVPPGSGDAYNFLSSTLFDPLAPENCGQKRQYCFDQQIHLSQLTEEVMVKRFPAMALDYVYELQIPEEWIDKASLVTTTFLEESNWKESSVCRVVVGPFCADVDSSMVHFCEKLLQSAKDYDYPPYFTSDSGNVSIELRDKDLDDLPFLEEFIPFRSYHLTCFKPVLRFSAADHLHYDSSSKSEKRKLRKKKKGDTFKEKASPLLPMLEMSAECIDLQFHTPMYPVKVSRIVSLLPSPSDHLLNHCYDNYSFKLFGLEVMLLKSQAIQQSEEQILPSLSATFLKKAVCNPEYWMDQNNFSFAEYDFDCSSIKVIITEPAFLTLLCMYQSWTKKDFLFDQLTNFAAAIDHVEGNIELSCDVEQVDFSVTKTESLLACRGLISSVCVKLQDNEHSTDLFHGPEFTTDAHKSDFFLKQSDYQSFRRQCCLGCPSWFQILFQIPNEVSMEACVMVVYMKGVSVCLEPALLTFLSQDSTNFLSSSVSDSCSLVSPTSFEDDSTCSSQTPIASGSLSFSQGQSIVEENSESDICEDVQKYLLDNYDLFKSLKLQVELENIIVLIPDAAWSIQAEENTPTLQCWANTINSHKLTTACFVCFPRVTIQNNGSQYNLEPMSSIFDMKLPLNLCKGAPKNLDLFPWTLKIQNFCIYTVSNDSCEQNIFFLWSPSSATATIAVTAKHNHNQLAVCIHVDTTAVNISYSALQVQFLVNSITTVTSFARFSHVIKLWLLVFIQKLELKSISVTSKSKQSTNKDDVFIEPKLSAEDKGHPVSVDISESSSSKTVSINKRKVTLWIQFTLSKCSLNFFGRFESLYNTKDFHCQFITEEVITSLDVQDVYIKAKLKISSLNMNYFLKKPEQSDWYPGLHNGIVICCNNSLRRNVKNLGCSDIGSTDHLSSKQNQPFLLITFTQALSVHAKQKWTSLSEENYGAKGAAKYISEMDFNVRPFDLILWMSLFKAIYDACLPLKNLFFEHFKQPMKAQNLSLPTGINFSNQTLPLVYINASSMRIFFPKCFFPYENADNENPQYVEKATFVEKRNPDMLLLYVDHINLTSQVENPLSRIIINMDLYEAALNSKTLMLPGSDIEDRQYQLDICGLSFGSVASCDILKNNDVKETPRTHMQIMGENPALEWNTGVVNESRKQGNEEPLLIAPLLSAVDIKLAVAPAIVSKNSAIKESVYNIVSGITVEISVANEIFLYFSIKQLRLLTLIIDNSLNTFSHDGHSDNLSSGKLEKLSLRPVLPKDILLDSGVQSETSTFIYFDLPELPTKVNETYNFVPFEVLITASSISIILFVHEEDLVNEISTEFGISETSVYDTISDAPSGSQLKHPIAKNFIPSLKCLNIENVPQKEQNAPHISKKSVHKHSSPCSSHENKNKKTFHSLSSESEVQLIYPFVFVSITQPHTFVKICPSHQRFEVSCFDGNVRGSYPNHVIETKASTVVPSIADFPLSYLETKPGKPDEKTGIPPAFWTIMCTDFLYTPSRVQVRIERPVKCNIDSDLFNQSEKILNSVNQNLLNASFFSNNKEKAKVLEATESTKDSLALSSKKFNLASHLLNIVANVELHTTQIVIKFYVQEGQKCISVITSVDGLVGESKYDIATSCCILFKLDIKLNGLILKVDVSKDMWPILLPLSGSLILKHQVEPYIQTKLSVEGEAIYINFSYKHVVALLEAVEYIRKKIERTVVAANKHPDASNLHATKKVAKHCKKKLSWHDDLRKGSFYFNQTFTQGSSKPNVHEIVFSKAELNQPAAMTWRYPEPRVITKVEVSPVPFHCTIDQQLGENTLQMVTCYIQFWDSLHHKFINKCNFQLSEVVHNYLEFPVDSNTSVEFSDTWRVILDYGDVTFDCESSKNEKKSLLSPLALAACLCIDSFHDPNIIPTAQIMLSFSQVKINFYNYFSSAEFTFGSLLPFTFDDVAPLNQEFLVLTICKPNFHCIKWLTGFKIEGFFEMGCNVLEYKNLTMVPFFDSFDFQFNGHAYYQKAKVQVLELGIILQPCFIKISQSIIHTLKLVIHSCSSQFNETDSALCSDCKLANYYVICNNTQETLRFGQVDTDESIILPPKKMHAYSWRSHKRSQKLQVSFECMKWKWSEAFEIESSGMQKVNLSCGVTLNVKVKSLSNLQKQVVIEGEFIVYNCHNLDVNVKFDISSPSVLENPQPSRVIDCNLKQSAATTVVISRSEQVKICISLMMNHHVFSSEWINISEVSFKTLIPMYGKETQVKNILIHIINKSVDVFNFTLISVNPSYVIRNYLPCPLTRIEKILPENETINQFIEGNGKESQYLDDISCKQDVEVVFQNNYKFNLHIPSLETFVLEVDNRSDSDEKNEAIKNFLLSDIETTALFANERSFSPFHIINSVAEIPKEYGCDICKKKYACPVAFQTEISEPKIVVETNQRWNGLYSSVIDIKPWALFFNNTELEFILLNSDKMEHKLPPNSFMMPPHITECFCLAIQIENQKFLSAPMRLLEEKPSKHVLIEGEVPEIGSINVVIPIQTDFMKACVFRLKSEFFDGIRVLSILPLVFLKNNSSHEFYLSLSVALLSSFYETKNVSCLATNSVNSNTMPLMFWEVKSKAPFHFFCHDRLQISFDIAVRLCSSTEQQWSYPLRLLYDLPPDMRHTFAFPSGSGKIPSMSFVLSSHHRQGIWYLVISNDPSPVILLHNKTSSLFFYGQSVTKSENVTVYEELNTNFRLPSLQPNSSSYYTFPSLQRQFPKFIDSFPKIHLGCEDESTSSYIWSPPINVELDNQFVCIPEVCYVKISREKIGHTINLFIDLVNRVEFTADEIRSRIGVTSSRTVHSSGPDIQLDTAKYQSSEDVQKIVCKQKKVSLSTSSYFPKSQISKVSKAPFALCLTVKASHISVSICDELKDSQFCTEVLRFNMQDVLLYSRSNEKSSMFNYVNEISLCFGDIQIDNQVDHDNTSVFDFPVILKQHNASNLSPVEADPVLLPNKAREKAFVTIEVILEIQPLEKTFIFQTIKISCKPLSLYLEDALYYKVLSLFKAYIPPNSNCYAHNCNFLYFPRDVVCIASAFVYPVRIQYLKIDVPEIYLTVHASLKLYLSVENSLLKFQPFSKSEIFTNFYELGRVIVVHYLTGALFRAGWVVGSLDLLGNPANFARAVGSGLADFILLPYHGLLNGPRAFITGLTNGATSLISGISAGAITCVTNLAASISRNMDLLSLDAQHLAHQEMLRRQLPSGVATGLLQGLSGLGISLLGAIAGVVDHPLQVFVTPTNPLNTAKGVVGGLGKGILGFLTKPVGGAAEFVSQTGHGLLHEAGWLTQSKRQHQPFSARRETYPNSLLKYKWKIFPTTAFGEVLLFIEATHIDENGYYEENILILTSEVLSLFDPEEDTQKKTFALSEIKCQKSEKDKSAVLISQCDQQKSHLLQNISDVNDRVADYVQKSCLFKAGAMYFKFDDEANVLSYEFFVQPDLRSLFLALFSSAKRTLHQKGFSVY